MTQTQWTTPQPPRERRISIGEWAAMSEDEEGELVDGRLVEEEVASTVHELIVAWFVRNLGNWVDPLEGFAFGSELKFAVSPRRGRKPDASVFLPGSRMPPTMGPVETPPDIAIEVVSPTLRDGRRDRIDKLDEYAAFGVRWYWIVDPQLRSLEIFALSPEGRYLRALGATDTVIERVPGCEGLSLDLVALWRRLDQLAPPAAPKPGTSDE